MRREAVVIWLNRAALACAGLIVLALGTLWWLDRTHPAEAPRWDPARFANLVRPAGPAGALWLVAVNPDCPHCRARLADLERHGVAEGAALAVLLVDTPHRPDAVESSPAIGAGVWWDSSGVWRWRWRRRAYGEVLVFDASGRLERVTPPTGDPGSPATRGSDASPLRAPSKGGEVR